MYIEAVPNRNSPPAIPLRENYRHAGKVRKRTLCNLSDWSPAHIEGLRGVLKGGTVIPAGHDALTVTRSLPHRHVAAALGTARKIGLDRILGPDGNRCRDLFLAMLIGRALRQVGVVGFFPVSCMVHPRAWDQARTGWRAPVRADLAQLSPDSRSRPSGDCWVIDRSKF